MDWIRNFFRPQWQHSSPEVRIEALGKITDESVLAKVASNDSAEKVRLAAVERLSSPELLSQVARNEEEKHWIRKKAVQGIHDQDLLKKLSMESDSSEVAETSTQKIFDQSVLAEIAQKAVSYTARRCAVDQLTSLEYLLVIARHHQDGNIVKGAFSRIKAVAPVLLEELFREFENPDLRFYILRHLLSVALQTQLLAEFERLHPSYTTQVLKELPCNDCNGKGMINRGMEWTDCYPCGGKGYVMEYVSISAREALQK
ncbi:MAG: hypothetical protein A2521_17165 [Deltaproteobacteria bacterium RIFOXYD12_FULL_57_12]|nr:MAG: hypothetical protein A2521_17165 [Deltaproteobacteria bacterium RIFOXYD12_FULL_57_12]